MYFYDSNGTAQKVILNQEQKQDQKNTLVEAYGEGECPYNCPCGCRNCKQFRMCRDNMKTWCMLGIIVLIVVFVYLMLCKGEKSIKSSFGRNPRFGYKF